MSDPINEKKVNDIYHSVGLLNNLRDEEVRSIINSQYKFIYETIKNLQLEGLTDEEINELKKTFTLKYIGKLYTSSDVIRKHKFKENIVRDVRAKELE